MKHGSMIGSALALLALLLAFAPPARAGDLTLTVAKDPHDCPKATFTSIQAAVTAAAPGTKIVVCPGTYTEMVTITTNQLTITSRGGPAAVIVEGDIQNPNGAPEAGFLLHDVSGVVIEGFTVQGFHESDIIVRGGSHNTIRENKTTKSAHDGIQVQHSSGNLVERNVSFNNDAGPPARAFTDACGILVFDGAAENVLRRNEVFGNAFGILVGGGAGSRNVVDRNDSHDNRRYGILTRGINGGANGTLIDRNEVTHNRVSNLGPGRGIAVELGATNVVVTRNEAFDNTPDLFWDQLGSATFSRNTCATSQPPGLCQGREDSR